MRGKFLLLDKWVDRIGYWAGGYTVLSGVVSWGASHLAFLQPYGWAETIFFSMAVSAVLVLVLCACLVAWRFFKPITAVPGAASVAATAEEDQSAFIRKRIDDLSLTVIAQNESRDRDFSEVSASISKLAERTSKLEGLIQPKTRGLLDYLENGDFNSRFDLIDANIKDVRSNIDTLSSMIKDTINTANHNHAQLHDRVYNLFRARDVEREMDRLLAEIDPLSTKLRLAMSDSIGITIWSDWNEAFELWRDKLEELAQVVAPYINIDERVFSINPERYKPKNWNICQIDFPNGDQAHDFKTFSIILEQFQQVKSGMIIAIRNKARV